MSDPQTELLNNDQPLIDAKPRRGRPPKAVAEDALPDEVEAEDVTYMPGDGDPASTKWRGIVFHANVPKPISKRVLLEAARGNKFFKVGKFDPSRDGAPLPDFNGDPKTADEYRRHAVGWINKLGVHPEPDTHPRPEDLDEMIKTWIAETRMREMCEVGSDDYSYIGTLFLPKMYELARVAELNNDQLVKRWASYGITQLPF